jgi:hypothetical protein
VYVDDVLVINRCVPEIQPSLIDLTASNGKAIFKDIHYYGPKP